MEDHGHDLGGFGRSLPVEVHDRGRLGLLAGARGLRGLAVQELGSELVGDGLEGGDHLAHGWPLRELPRAPMQNVGQRLGNLVGPGVQTRRLELARALGLDVGAAVGERRVGVLPGDHLEQQDPEVVDVHGFVGVGVDRLLRADEADCAHGLVDPRQTAGRPGSLHWLVCGCGVAEVEELDPRDLALGLGLPRYAQQVDVVGGRVAMNDPGLVADRERERDLVGHPYDLAGVHGLGRPRPAQGLTEHHLGRQPRPSALGETAVVDDLDQVGVTLETLEIVGLVDQASLSRGATDVARREQLEGDLSTERSVVGEEHRAHSAFAQMADNLKTSVADHCAQRGELGEREARGGHQCDPSMRSLTDMRLPEIVTS